MKVSIITPSYNQAKFIEETIRSVIYQAGDFELDYIIIDGGSTDGTLEIIQRYAAMVNSSQFTPHCTRLTFQWHSEQDRGQSHAINKGFRKTTGDIINWLCSDDILTPGALQTYVDHFTRNPDSHVVTANSCRIDHKGKRIFTISNKPASRRTILEVWKDSYPIQQPTTFVRKAVLETCGLLNEKNHLYMDYEWHVNIIRHFDFAFIAKETAYLRYHDRAKSVRYGKKQLVQACEFSRTRWGIHTPYCACSFFVYGALKKMWACSAWLKERSNIYTMFVQNIKKIPLFAISSSQ